MATSAPTQPLSTAVAWPIHGQITTYFGVYHMPYQPTHTGLDISTGRRAGVMPVHPFKAGVVTQVIHSNKSLGNHIVIDHGGGLTSVYGHLYSISVQLGQTVDLNTELGREGTTGVSTGPHVHFEIKQDGVYQNPLKYVPGRP
jgi:murein DD-endopeptidase MepM/ murein hydrolase activator NlpD